jgi:NADH:ubiquinone oxidoreductase subunit 3 (subunit A)
MTIGAFIPILAMIVLATGFSVVSLGASWLASSKRPYRAKSSK